MEIEHIERVNVLSKKVLNCEATLQELSEYKSLLKRWADNIQRNELNEYYSEELIEVMQYF